MPRRFRLVPLLCCLLPLWLLGACSEPDDSLTRILERGELRLVTRNGPTTYFVEREQARGFEYELAAALADELGVALRVEVAYSLDGLFDALRRDRADIAAAGLALTRERAREFPASAPYLSLHPVVIQRSGESGPRKPADLVQQDIVVLKGSSHQQWLRALRQTQPQLRWRTLPGTDVLSALESVERGEADLTLVDATEFRIHRNLLPRLSIAFALDTVREAVWYFSPQSDSTQLEAYVADFIQRQREDGRLATLRQAHFEHVEALDRIGAQTFIGNLRERLPVYRPHIEQVAREHQLDWALLAAMAYQESHWDPGAVSYTGVRGMMMLTTRTAGELGIEDREDVMQSLRGGARYFKDLRRRLPDGIRPPDRTWMALAAYNIGMGHLEDARVITQRHGGDPNLWADVMQHLPKLERSEHFSTVKHGYARGTEAVHYVQNIRHYHNVLQWRFIAENHPQPPVDLAPLLPAALRDVDLLGL
jgi:membrane-bound lytic murein transglycosylase F